MKAKLLSALAMFFFILSAYAQTSSIDLTFTSVDSGAYVRLGSIKVMNRTQGCDTVLYWPDTVLSVFSVGIPEINTSADGFQVFQNYPNPAPDQTIISLFVPEKDLVNLIISDMTGRVILHSSRMLDKGIHFLRFSPGNGNLYYFSANWGGSSRSIKIIHAVSGSSGACTLTFLGNEASSFQLKSTEHIQNFSFSPGDELLCIGYTDTLQSGILDAPETSKTYTFQFATNIPCPGTPTISYEGQVYNTIQIFSQCWMKENLNVGTMINGTQNQANNGSIEKYCYDNQIDSCTKYGGLYQWNEMMQYTTQQGSRGICPPDWHLPTDEDLKLLKGAVDSQFGIGDNEWTIAGLRGFDAGRNLKSTNGWQNDGNGTDLYGFSALPASYRVLSGGFDVTGAEGVWWSSTEYITNYAWYTNIHYFSPQVGRFADMYSYRDYGFSVRCLRDY